MHHIQNAAGQRMHRNAHTARTKNAAVENANKGGLECLSGTYIKAYISSQPGVIPIPNFNLDLGLITYRSPSCGHQIVRSIDNSESRL